MLGLNLEETRVYQDAKQEGRQEGWQEGRQDEAIHLILRQLTRRLKQELPEEVRSQISTLSLPVLEELGESLVDFENLENLLTLLQQHCT
ncbi:MAG TPA: DUF4351 domain-containing protein [Coleofasciculaceae cyanobacterium]|jgi:predicted transposase YdaD